MRVVFVVVVVVIVLVDWERVKARVCGDCNSEAERDRVIRIGDSSGVEVGVASPFLRFLKPSEALSVVKSLSCTSCEDESRFRVSSAVPVVVGFLLFEPLDATATFFFEVWKYWFNRPLKLVFLFTGTSKSLSSYSSCLYPL